MTGSLTLREIACDAVQVTDRHRRDMGDLELLATSIATEGLLQPIGITEDNVLVFGERRLLAVRDILREPTIVARVVHVSSVLAGEYAENGIRKDFTESERVALRVRLKPHLATGRGNVQTSNLRTIVLKLSLAKMQAAMLPPNFGKIFPKLSLAPALQRSQLAWRASATARPTNRRRRLWPRVPQSWCKPWTPARYPSTPPA